MVIIGGNIVPTPPPSPFLLRGVMPMFGNDFRTGILAALFVEEEIEEICVSSVMIIGVCIIGIWPVVAWSKQDRDLDLLMGLDDGDVVVDVDDVVVAVVMWPLPPPTTPTPVATLYDSKGEVGDESTNDESVVSEAREVIRLRGGAAKEDSSGGVTITPLSGDCLNIYPPSVLCDMCECPESKLVGKLPIMTDPWRLFGTLVAQLLGS